MEIFTVTLVITIMIMATVFVTVRHFRRKEMSDRRSRYAPFVMWFCVLLIAADALVGDDAVTRLPSNLIFSLSSMLILTSPFWEDNDTLLTIISLLAVQSALFLYHVMASAGLFPLLPLLWYVRLTCFAATVLAIIYMVAVHLRIREVRLVIRHGNVWSCLCMMVDMIYLLFIMIYAFLFSLGTTFSHGTSFVFSNLISLFLALECAALGFRVGEESVFVLCSRHERRIAESMKISHVEVTTDMTKINEVYRTIYERVVQLFENDRMYLNSELTINDVVKIVYTNKLYISRAISQFTGRNFCQFVNYYRVIHSVRLFRENPELKVSELAAQSGFNSSVTFAMAFRLYMSESPSDWCRKEKYKIIGKKK